MILEQPIEQESRSAVYNRTERGRDRKKRYRHTSGVYRTRSRYLSVPFIAVDGAAITLPNGEQAYTYLALSTGASIRDDSGLDTFAIINFLQTELPPSKDAIPVMFGGNVDFNHWLKDVSRDELKRLQNATFRDHPLDIGQYKLRMQAGRQFTIKSPQKFVSINDISSFFQSTFTDALKEWLEPDHHTMRLLDNGRAMRDTWRVDDMPSVVEYVALELHWLVRLADKLRETLDNANLRPRRWTGPGNSVSTLFRRFDIKAHMDHSIPPEVAQASRYAFAGGRIEVIKHGMVRNQRSYEYDKRSAYPEAVAQLPSLAGGTWEHYNGDPGTRDFALYKVKTFAYSGAWPGPQFHRSNTGAVSFPVTVTNWVWSPEMEAIREWADAGLGTVEVSEAFIFIPATEVKPFGWINDLYRQRMELREAGDDTEKAIKLVLNAIYGKLMQQLGYVCATGRRLESIPPYHQLEWAGFVTSWTRAALLRACIAKPWAVIAFETDCVFSSEPLDLPVGVELGKWKVQEWRSLCYVQSGIYYGDAVGKGHVFKLRGYDVGSTRPAVIRRALLHRQEQRIITIKEDRFVSLGVALEMPTMEHWRKWIETTRKLRAYPVGKRVHEFCCDDHSNGLELERWHTTVCPMAGVESQEYVVEWINPVENMARYSQLRKELTVWE